MATSVPSRRMAIGAARTDWPGVIWISPLRYAIVCAALVAFALTYATVSVAVSLTIGALFAGVADPRGPFPARLRAMTLATILVTVAAVLGIAASQPTALHVVASVVVAAVCGYLGVASPRAAVAGVLALVTFIIFSGAPEPLDSATTIGFWVLMGGLAQIAVLISLRLLGRMDGIRAEVGIAFRGLGLALRDPRTGPSAVQTVARVNAARVAVRESETSDATHAWFMELVERCDRARIGLLALRAERQNLPADPTARIIAFDDVAANLCIAIATTLQGTGRRRTVQRRRDDLRRALATADSLPPTVAALVREVADELDRAAAVIAEPWPIGPRSGGSLSLGVSAEPFKRLLRRDDPDRLFLRHAIRLAILIGIATAVARFDPLGHSYWIPMTVAWVTKPDFAGTAVRIFSRIGGTVIGLVVATGILGAFGGSQAVVIALIGVSAFAAFGFMQPNYAICTAGVTSYVLALFYLDGDPLVDTAFLRILGTVVAAVAIWVVIRLWPTRTGDRICLDLAEQARALRRYAQSIHDDDAAATRETRADLIQRRVKADAAIVATALEPGRHALHDADARAIFDDLVQASAVAASADVTGDRARRAEITRAALQELDIVAHRLEALNETGHPTRHDRSAQQVDTPFARAVDDAQTRLDLLVS